MAQYTETSNHPVTLRTRAKKSTCRSEPTWSLKCVEGGKVGINFSSCQLIVSSTKSEKG